MDNIREELEQYRAQIDDVDRELLACLAARFRLSETIGLLKRSADVHVVQQDRATEVKNRYETLGTSQGLRPDFILELFHLIHQESCRVQDSLR